MKNKRVEEVKIALIDLESEMQILQDVYANEDDSLWNIKHHT